MTEDKSCRGCVTRINSGTCIWYHESLECPCATCLIKMMCIDKCELLDKHITKIYKAMGIKTLHGQINYIMGKKND